jgi:hypothetical protein
MNENPSGNSSPGGGYSVNGSCGNAGPLHGFGCYCHWCIDGTMMPAGPKPV